MLVLQLLQRLNLLGLSLNRTKINYHKLIQRHNYEVVPFFIAVSFDFVAFVKR